MNDFVPMNPNFPDKEGFIKIKEWLKTHKFIEDPRYKNLYISPEALEEMKNWRVESNDEID